MLDSIADLTLLFQLRLAEINSDEQIINIQHNANIVELGKMSATREFLFYFFNDKIKRKIIYFIGKFF